jgi:hypothetical protein
VRHVRMLGLCLVAVCGLAIVVAASSASAAEPEYGRCVATKGGHYQNNSCTEEAPKSKTGKFKGKYEWKAGAPVGEECVAQKHGEYTNSNCTTKSAKPKKGTFEKLGPKFKGEGGASVLESNYFFCVRGNQKANDNCENSKGELEESEDSTGVQKIECTSETASGELSGTKDAIHVDVVFHGCHYVTFSCENTAVEGEVKVNELEGSLGYINKAKKEVGVVLHPVGGKPFAQFGCAENIDYVTVGESRDEPFESTEGQKTIEEPWYSGGGGDGIISPVTPIDHMAKAFTQVYTVEDKTTPGGLKAPANVPNQFEGGSIELLEDWLTDKEAGLAASNRSAWSPAGEVVTNVNTGEGEIEIKA